MATWWTYNEDRRQAPGAKISDDGTDLVYQLAVQPVITTRMPYLGIRIRITVHDDGSETVRLAWMRWED
jgi:hypothetical protein